MAEEIQKDDVELPLSLAARPRTLDGLIGQQKLVAAIRGHIQTKRYPKAWLFHGPKGTGKTSTARIVALSYQCAHQELFGRPCKDCRRHAPRGIPEGIWSNFPIVEIPAARISKVEDIKPALAGANSGVMGFGRYRVYIINEVQRCSPASVSLFLDMLEDTPKTTAFIFTTTEASHLSEAFRSRCQCYEFKDLDADGAEQLVMKLLKKIESDLPADRLLDALLDAKVFSPRLIAQAVEKYAAGCAPEEAAQVSGAPDLDIMALSKSITRGDWPGVARYLQVAEGGDTRGLRPLLLKYLRSQLLESSEIGPRADAIAKAIALMAAVTNAEDEVVFAAVCSSAYRLTKIFGNYTV